MQLSVIILNYKVPYYLLQCVESVQKSIRDLDAETIVVDNHSEDQSCALINTHFPEVKVIANSTNSGFSKGNNIGVDQARGDLICLLNPDTVVGENTFKTLLDFVKTKPDFGIVGPQLIDGRGEFLPESKRNVPTPKVALQKLLNRTKAYYSPIKPDQTGEVDVLVGAFMLMKKDRYFEVGKLDEDYFMYGEDIDLSYKFLKAGYKNYYYGAETVLHFKGESTARDKVYRERFFGAMKIFYQKHFQDSNLTGFFVAAGLRLAKTTRQFKKTKVSSQKEIIRHIWVSREEKGRKPLEALYEKPFERVSIEELTEETITDSLLVFDAASVSYDQIIKMMHRLKYRGNKFRINPSGFDYIIGSDSRTGRGQVQLFSRETRSH